jgi:hypothetical protein
MLSPRSVFGQRKSTQSTEAKAEKQEKFFFSVALRLPTFKDCAKETKRVFRESTNSFFRSLHSTGTALTLSHSYAFRLFFFFGQTAEKAVARGERAVSNISSFRPEGCDILVLIVVLPRKDFFLSLESVSFVSVPCQLCSSLLPA